MSYQERRSLVSLIGTLILLVVYGLFISGRAQAAGPEVANDLQFWATAILLLIPVMIAFGVVLEVAYVVGNIIATRREEPDIRDEYDRLVSLKSTRNFYHTFMAAFVLAMLAVALGQPAAAMFVVLLAGIFAASVVIYASEIYYYRRGV